MNQQTRVTGMRIRERTPETPPGLTQPIELPRQEEKWNIRFLNADRLMRNLAVSGALLLTVVAIRNIDTPRSQSVFSALQASAGMEWDESVGKLSFVGGMLPEGIRAVWNEKESVSVLAPLQGETVHAWTRQEPYLAIAGVGRDVRAAADGEIMSIAHGPEEERIVRIRHDDGSETLYGNLQSCWFEEGDRVAAGDVLATLMEEKPLAFELRINGRSVDPAPSLGKITE